MLEQVIEKLLTLTKPSAIFGDPVTEGGVTVITASEVNAVVGYGYGSGSSEEGGEGGGGGGGGPISNRPVAAIVIQDGKVRVEPIVDASKIAVTFITAVGAVIMARVKLKQFMAENS